LPRAATARLIAARFWGLPLMDPIRRHRIGPVICTLQALVAPQQAESDKYEKQSSKRRVSRHNDGN